MYSPIFLLLEDLYGMSLFAVQYLSLIYLLSYPPLNVPAVYVLEKHGLRVGILIGITCTAIGQITKCFLPLSTAFLLTG